MHVTHPPRVRAARPFWRPPLRVGLSSPFAASDTTSVGGPGIARHSRRLSDEQGGTDVDGVEAAISTARETPAVKDVTIASTNDTQQALDLGQVDEVCVSLVPVLFGAGVPYFSRLDRGHLLLDDPAMVHGRRALRLRSGSCSRSTTTPPGDTPTAAADGTGRLSLPG